MIDYSKPPLHSDNTGKVDKDYEPKRIEYTDYIIPMIGTIGMLMLIFIYYI